jgi:hypothetical protein
MLRVPTRSIDENDAERRNVTENNGAKMTDCPSDQKLQGVSSAIFVFKSIPLLSRGLG